MVCQGLAGRPARTQAARRGSTTRWPEVLVASFTTSPRSMRPARLVETAAETSAKGAGGHRFASLAGTSAVVELGEVEARARG